MMHQLHTDLEHGTWNYLRALAYQRGSAENSATDEDHAPAFTIAISRETAVDAGAVAQALARRLGWKVWDHELLVLIAHQLHTKASDLVPVDETHINWLQESIECLLDMHTVSQVAYVHQLVKTLDALAALGNSVVVGRGAAHILPAETTLRVRLIAPREERIEYQARLTDGNRHAAQRYIDHTDRQRRRFVQEHFHKDPDDPANYDLVLNMARLPIDDCAAQIIDALRAEQQLRAHRFALRAMPPAVASRMHGGVPGSPTAS